MKTKSSSLSLRRIGSATIVAASLAGSAATALADVYICAPAAVATVSTRVHVRCTVATPAGIVYFAVCSDGNSAYAARALSMFTTAKVTGKNLAVFYEPADTSGTACGCGAGDCRVIWAAEVQP